MGFELKLAEFLDESSKSFLRKDFIGSLKPEGIAKLRDIASTIFNGSEQFLNGGSGVVVLDVPGIGTGAEVSLFLTGGEFSVGGTL